MTNPPGIILLKNRTGTIDKRKKYSAEFKAKVAMEAINERETVAGSSTLDITYIPMSKGFLYLTTIIDVYSRMIVGWGLHNNLDSTNSRAVLLTAIRKYGKPEIVNSNQGAQYTCKEWVDTLKANDIRINMDGRNRYLEYIYINPEGNGTDLYKGINRFIEHYNEERPHQGICHQTSAERYQNVA
jgi:putative transposase